MLCKTGSSLFFRGLWSALPQQSIKTKVFTVNTTGRIAWPTSSKHETIILCLPLLPFLYWFDSSKTFMAVGDNLPWAYGSQQKWNQNILFSYHRSILCTMAMLNTQWQPCTLMAILCLTSAPLNSILLPTLINSYIMNYQPNQTIVMIPLVICIIDGPKI